jgi:hypothetical protein
VSPRLARHIVVLALIGAVALLGVGAAGAVDAKVCKPKTAKKCKKHVVKKKPVPKPKPAPAPAPTPTPTPPPAPTNAVTLTMGADMPAAQGNAIKQGVEIAQQYFAKLGGIPSTWHADIYAEPTFDAIVADYAKATGSDSFARSQCPNGCAFTGGVTKIFIFPFGSSYYRPDELAGHTKTPVHELWHTVQSALAPKMYSPGSDGLFIDGPNWLREGSADFIGYSALTDARIDASSLRSNALYDTKVNYAGVTLESTASGQGNGAAYSLGFFAVQLLVKDTGSMHSLVDYWTKIGQGTAWPTAFQLVFGRTIDQFYTEFAAYRQTL